MLLHFKKITALILPLTVLVIVPSILEYGFHFHLGWNLPLGLILISIGLLVLVKTMHLFHSVGNGTLAPWDPPENLVTNGLYAYVRNPMIIGVIIILLGESLSFLSLKILLWAMAFFLLNNLHFHFYEEPTLTKSFGKEYNAYKKNVSRWIPRKKPHRSH